jgi:hypothetical protein
MKTSNKHRGSCLNNDSNDSNCHLINSSIEIELPPDYSLPSAPNQSIAEASHLDFALSRFAHILIDIARNPKSQQTEPDSDSKE